ncbi:hypothetical protein CPLU01_00719 [Colletotrichum plurivorum]|uniref:Secreted protein n=1 Tax=Colletotrichum plurivorum TaxID=2175906 RepID=A0A8H6NRI8_9PEZI|nr:hypothetical protein CPLU01_00719 [Colletotrichum plurivorum]
MSGLPPPFSRPSRPLFQLFLPSRVLLLCFSVPAPCVLRCTWEHGIAWHRMGDGLLRAGFHCKCRVLAARLCAVIHMDAVRFTPPSTGEPGLEHDPFIVLTQDIPPDSTPSPKKAAPPPLFFVAHGMPWDGMGMAWLVG